MKQVISIKKVFICLKVNDFILKKDGILNNSLLQFEDRNVKYQFDLKSLILIRESDQYSSEIDFVNKNFSYCLNCLSNRNKICSKIVIKQLLNENSSVIINYRIGEDNFNLILSYEEV